MTKLKLALSRPKVSYQKTCGSKQNPSEWHGTTQSIEMNNAFSKIALDPNWSQSRVRKPALFEVPSIHRHEIPTLDE